MSVVLSLTLTPMLCGQFLKRPEPPSNPFIRRRSSAGFRWLEAGYARALDVVLRHMRLTLVVFLATAGLAVVLYVVTPTGFFPQQDTGFIRGVMRHLAGRLLRPRCEQKIEQVGNVLEPGSGRR